jgi:DNA-binding transcriptional ArsR family regulator
MTYANYDAVFVALADSTRRALLGRLAHGEATVMELAAPFAMSQPAISQHLKILQHAGLIARRIDGTKRPCRLSPEGVRAIDEWLAPLRTALARNYDRLDGVLAQMTSRKLKGRRR